MTERAKVESSVLMLPFLANDTLSAEERERLESHVEGSASARKELAFLRLVRTALQEAPSVEGPTERERAQILERVCSGGDRGTKHSRGTIWALAAALLLALFEGGWIWQMSYEMAQVPSHPEPAVESYRPAGSSTSAQIAVQFTDAATAKEIRELLLGQGLLVVDGPSALGVYQLILGGGGAVDAERIAKVVEALRVQPIVSYAGAL
jgi:hypothetical protein